MFRVALILAIFGFVAYLFVLPNPNDRRVALVIGNGDYIHAKTLDSAQINASKVSRSLRRFGFDVIERSDLNRPEIQTLFQKFKDRLIGADVAVLYYSGFVSQSKGNSYITPIDASIEDDPGLEFKAALLQPLLKDMASRSKASLVIFDACRALMNDDLMRDDLMRDDLMRDDLARVKEGQCRALKAIPVQRNMMISYGANSDIDIEKMRHGVSQFTESVLSFADRKHALIQNVMLDVVNDVSTKTNRQQIPRMVSTLETTISLNLGAEPYDMSESLILVDDSDSGEEIVSSRYRSNPTALHPGSRLAPASKPLHRDDFEEPKDEPKTIMSLAMEELKRLGGSAGAKTRAIMARLDTREKQLRIFGDLKRREEISDVERQLQRQLARLGCYTGSIDGNWGTKSENALSLFNQSASLKLTSLSPHSSVLRLAESYTGTDCNVQRKTGNTQIAHSSSDESVKDGPASETNPGYDLSAIAPDEQIVDHRETTTPKRNSVVRRKVRVRTKASSNRRLYSRRPPAKSWQKRTLARILESD